MVNYLIESMKMIRELTKSNEWHVMNNEGKKYVVNNHYENSSGDTIICVSRIGSNSYEERDLISFYRMFTFIE